MSRTAPVDVTFGQEVLGLLTGLAPPPLPRHRHDLSRADVRTSQAARIVTAAMELFAENGYAATAVSDITKRAGVSRKTFYELYDDKEDAFVDSYRVVELLIAGAGIGDLTDAQTAMSGPESIADLVERFLLLFGFAPAATKMFFLEAVGVSPRVRARRNEAIAEFVAAITPTWQDLRARFEPDLPPLPVDVCHAMTAAAIEMIIEHLADHEPTELVQLTPRFTDLILAIVTPNHTS